MTSRERFRRTMAYEPVDRVPYFEEGLRDEVIDAWRKQGLAGSTDPREAFDTDRRERVPVNVEPRLGDDDPPTYAMDLDELARRLDPEDPTRWPDDWDEKVATWRDREHVLELGLHAGIFLTLGIDGWRKFHEAVLLLKDDPARVRAIMEMRGRLAAGVAERVLADVEVDMVSFSEPIGGNDGPLLSPATYEDFVLSSYQPAVELARRHGVPCTCLVTYANARALVPSFLAGGFNCLWACEVNTEAMDYLDLRREFGRELRLIGGIDLDVLLADEETIRNEIESKVPPLLAQGGYIPLADGRVREYVPYERYAYYRETLRRTTEKA